jgi:hypothetical protein
MKEPPIVFSDLVGVEQSGGCDECGATQAMTADPHHPGVWHLIITHDDDCPAMRQRCAGMN